MSKLRSPKSVKIGKTSYNVEAIKRQSLTDWRKTHGKQYGDQADEIYYRITGKKKTKRTKKQEGGE